MRVGCGPLKASLILAGCLVLPLLQVHAQKNAASGSADAARTILVEKAHILEARGRLDMAIQLWQQILLSTPDNAEALAALARDYKLTGAAAQADQTLDRLRRVSPGDPEIARIEAMSSTSSQSDQLRQAGELARQGRSDDAMRIYRQLYGDEPPNGDIALAYYETLYGTANGKPAAVAGMRALVDRNPGDPRYRRSARHHAHLRRAHARRRHSHSSGASQRSRRAIRSAPGAHLERRKSCLRSRAAPISRVLIPATRNSRPTSSKMKPNSRR